MKEICDELYVNLEKLGIIDESEVRTYNVGESNYCTKTIQPWTIWIDYPELTPWDHDIIKRVLRTKTVSGKSNDQSRLEDYQKIIHDCEERIRQLNLKNKINTNTIDFNGDANNTAKS